MNRIDQAVGLLLRQDSLQPYLHDRAIFATNRETWQAYTRDRTLTERQRDIVVDKLHVARNRRSDVRVRLESQRDLQGLVFSESLDFIRWAQKSIHPNRVTVTCLPQMNAERAKFILCHLLQASFGLSAQDASVVVDIMRLRDTDAIKAELRLLVVDLSTAACLTGVSVGYGVAACNLSAAAKGILAKAVVAGAKGKVALTAVGGLAKVVALAMRAASATNAAGAVLMVGTSMAFTGRQIWTDRHELGLIQYKDAEIFAAIQAFNDTAVDVDND